MIDVESPETPQKWNHFFCILKWVCQGVGKGPLFGILNLTFKYLLDMKYPQWLGDVQNQDIKISVCSFQNWVQHLETWRIWEISWDFSWVSGDP